MKLELATIQDLHEAKNEILDKLTELLEAKQATNKKEWLKTSEIKEQLGISNGTLQNMRISGLLHPKKILGSYYYSSKEIDKLFQ